MIRVERSLDIAEGGPSNRRAVRAVGTSRLRGPSGPCRAQTYRRPQESSGRSSCWARASTSTTSRAAARQVRRPGRLAGVTARAQGAPPRRRCALPLGPPRADRRRSVHRFRQRAHSLRVARGPRRARARQVGLGVRRRGLHRPSWYRSEASSARSVLESSSTSSRRRPASSFTIRCRSAWSSSLARLSSTKILWIGGTREPAETHTGAGNGNAPPGLGSSPAACAAAITSA